MSAARRRRSSASVVVSRASRSRSSDMLRRARTRSSRSAASACVSPRSSGTTAPSSIDARTARRISSGLASTAGGGLRPIRCSAASTSAMVSRRASSERLMAVSLDWAVSSRFSTSPTRSSAARARLVVSINAAARRARSLRMDSMSASTRRFFSSAAFSASSTPRNWNWFLSIWSRGPAGGVCAATPGASAIQPASASAALPVLTLWSVRMRAMPRNPRGSSGRAGQAR